MARKLKQRSFDIYSSFAYWAPGWRGVLLVAVMFDIGWLLGAGVTWLMCISLGRSDAVLLGSSLLSYPVMFIPAMLYASYQSRSEQSFGKGGLKLDSNNFAPYSALSICISVIAATVALAFAADIFGAILPPMPENLAKTMEMMTNGPLWISIISVCLFAPFFEEWLCRGVVLRGLLQHTKPIWAILVSALAFALIHGNIWQGIPAFLFGLLFGFVYYRTGSLKVVMLMHFTNNAFSLILSRLTAFKGANSFLDVMDAKIYAIAAAICLLWVAYFVLRMLKIRIPDGRRGNFDPIEGSMESVKI